MRLPVTHLFTSRDLLLRDGEREWTDVAASMGVERSRLLLVRQVHGTSVAIASRGDSRLWQRPEADAIVTDDPDVAIGVRVADCAPILVYDPTRRVVAAIHAGWRGASAGIAAVTIRTLKDAFGSSPGDLTAAVGPCLGGCCGEVGPEVVAAFESTFDRAARPWFTSGAADRSFLDLERANRDQLEQAGVPAASIFASGLCTKTHHDRLHSYRAHNANAGRMLAAIKAQG
jgi:hypothetical protein